MIEKNQNLIIFHFDKELNFILFYKKYDKDGVELFMTYYIAPDDNRLTNPHQISKVMIKN